MENIDLLRATIIDIYKNFQILTHSDYPFYIIVSDKHLSKVLFYSKNSCKSTAIDEAKKWIDCFDKNILVKCTKCHKLLPPDYFYGRNKRCKVCYNKTKKDYPINSKYKSVKIPHKDSTVQRLQRDGKILEDFTNKEDCIKKQNSYSGMASIYKIKIKQTSYMCVPSKHTQSPIYLLKIELIK